MYTIQYLLIFLIGASIGSFINVIALRFIAHESVTGRSRCPHCRKQLRWWELIPILSFFLLRGRCQRCQAKISAQYPLVEAASGALFLAAFHPWPLMPEQILGSIFLCALFAFLLILFLVDLHTLLLPDQYIVGVALCVAGLRILQPHYPSLISSISGALGGAGFLLFLWILTRGRGVGLGDVKLLLPLGALIGLPGTIVLLWLSFSGGGLIGGYLLLRGKARLKTALPFGPFLTASAAVVLLLPHVVTAFFSFLQL